MNDSGAQPPTKKKKRMRAAAVFTGVAAAAAATLGPATEAHASAPVPMPYFLDVKVTKHVKSLQVCGYISPAPGTKVCTLVMPNPGWQNYSGPVSAGDKAVWRRGHFNIWVWGYNSSNRLTEYLHSCNTNPGGWAGRVQTSSGGETLVTLARSGSGGLGRSTTMC